MERENRQAARILTAAILLGVAGDLLLRDTTPGINILLTTALLLCAAWFLRRLEGTTGRGRAVLFAVIALLAAGGFAVRDSPTLSALAGIVLGASALLGLFHARTGQGVTGGVWDKIASSLQTGVEIVIGGGRVLRLDGVRGTLMAGQGRSQALLAIVRGTLLAVPVLLVFGALLASADPVFAHYVAAAFQWDIGTVVSHLLWVAAGTGLAGGALRGLLTPPADAAPPSADAAAPSTDDAPPALAEPRFSLGRVETAIVLGALDLLFGAFVLVQMHYFFGGRDTVLTTAGMTYAAYARHGFFELVWVAGLCLPLLLTLHTGQQRGAHRQFNILASILLALLFVIMASALRRMNLYRSEYGLTELRLYTTAFMGWLAVVFAWFALTVLRGQRQYFAIGAAGFAAASVLVLFVLNPDAAIVRANARLAQTGKPFDACYAASLSADAVPELLARLPTLSLPAQQIAAARLLARWPDMPPTDDGRSWNRSRWAAEHSVQAERVHLLPLSAAAPAHACQTADTAD